MVTIEMRIMLITIVDAVMIVHPMVVITVYVDDISGEMIGPDAHIAKELGDCISEIALTLEDNHKELSKTKCVCATPRRTNLEEHWKSGGPPWISIINGRRNPLGSGWRGVGGGPPKSSRTG